MTYWIGCLSGTKEVSLVPITGKNKRLDYQDRLCRMNTRKGPSIWMDDCLANEWIKQPHSEETPDWIAY